MTQQTMSDAVRQSQDDMHVCAEHMAERANREFDAVKDDVRRFLALESFRDALSTLTLYVVESA